MIFVVSGEGPSDIGQCNNQRGECAGADFTPGPMAVIVDRIVEQTANYSPLASSAIEFISESALVSVEFPRSLISIGKKSKAGTAGFTRHAQQLAAVARRFEESGSPVAAVLFRDADGTRSTERGMFEAKWDAIERGFVAAGFENGVPMVPKPKSEAWLLCALKAEPYQHCANLEDTLSGNDDSPSPAKAQLEERLGTLGKEVNDLAGMVADGTISPFKIEMPSYRRFRTRLEEVTRRMFGLPAPVV